MSSLSFVITLFIVYSTVFPLLWLWNRRVGQRLTGIPRERHRRQTQRWLRMSGPFWVILLLLVGHELNDLHPVSREHHAFWFGFITASSLFCVALSFYNIVANWQERDKLQKARGNRQFSP